MAAADIAVDERSVAELASDNGQLTAVVFHRRNPAGADGSFAAGDLCVHVPQVATAIASGSHAAAAVVQSPMADEYGLAVPEGRHRVNA